MVCIVFPEHFLTENPLHSLLQSIISLQMESSLIHNNFHLLLPLMDSLIIWIAVHFGMVHNATISLSVKTTDSAIMSGKQDKGRRLANYLFDYPNATGWIWKNSWNINEQNVW